MSHKKAKKHKPVSFEKRDKKQPKRRPIIARFHFLRKNTADLTTQIHTADMELYGTLLGKKLNQKACAECLNNSETLFYWLFCVRRF